MPSKHGNTSHESPALKGLWLYCVYSQLGGGVLGLLLFYGLGHRLDYGLHFLAGALLGLAWLGSLRRGALLAGSKQARAWQVLLFSALRIALTSTLIVLLGLGQPLKTVIVLLGFLSYKLLLLALAIKRVIVSLFPALAKL
jgi:hypothetical protein